MDLPLASGFPSETGLRSETHFTVVALIWNTDEFGDGAWEVNEGLLLYPNMSIVAVGAIAFNASNVMNMEMEWKSGFIYT